MITAQEEVDLARRIRQGDEAALEKMVMANLRFVVSVAKQYHHSKVPLNDLINEGNLGLIKAARMFDETKGFKFISYAVWWIRQSIMDALDRHSRIVKIPANKIGGLSKINQASALMEQKFEREPTIEELAEFLGINVEEIKSTNVAAIRQSSLDAPFSDSEDGTLLDVLDNPDAETTDSALSDKESLSIELARILATLHTREKEIICRVFGIGYEYPQSIEDVSEKIGVSHERVRQIKEAALRKLRARAGQHLLQFFMN
jgi:RNA polymerase primary sigma factor